MNYDNLLDEECMFIEYETEHSKGRIVMLAYYFDKKAKKIMRLLKNATIRMYVKRKFTYQDIDFIKKGSAYYGS